MAPRKYLTTVIWFKDKLCSLPSVYLVLFCLACLLGLGALALLMFQFLDDLAFLIMDGDLTLAGIFFGLLLLTSIALWLLSCLLAALGRRLILYFRGL